MNRSRLLLTLLILVLAVVVLRNAWVCDDAYISFRTVDNFLNGYGLTWNTAERVQGYTAPLWIFVMAAAAGITGDFYYTSILLSLLLVVAAVVILVYRLSKSDYGAALAIAVLMMSKAFIDYSTSGLENPLSFLLLIVFAAILLTREWDTRALFWLAAIASLGTLNRPDAILLYFPALAVVLVRNRSWRAVASLVAGFAPLILWEMFALLYYGFPFPNTYYAKLHTGIAAGELMQQGFIYYFDSLGLDPITLLTIGASFVTVLARRDWKVLPIQIGIFLYLLYIVRIGGDFMSGRFFALPLLAALIAIVRLPDWDSWPARLVPIGIVLLIGLTSPRPPLFNDPSYGRAGEQRVDDTGIADERGFYYRQTGLLHQQRNRPPLAAHMAEAARNRRAGEDPVVEGKATGFAGYLSGPSVHIVDFFGLTDPLLARLPTNRQDDWRIGHFWRTMPAGYMETLRSGRNVIADPGLADYWDKIELITRGSLFASGRFRAIWDVNSGAADGLLRSYCNPPVMEANYAEVSGETPREYVIRRSGLRIVIDSVSHATSVVVGVESDDIYGASFFLDAEEVGWKRIKPRLSSDPGLQAVDIRVPPTAIRTGFNRIEVYPETGDDHYRVGYLKLIP